MKISFEYPYDKKPINIYIFFLSFKISNEIYVKFIANNYY